MKKYSKSYILTIISNTLMVLGALALIVALFLTDKVTADTILIAVACGVLALAFCVSLIRTVPVLFSKINHRSPEYKNAILFTIIAGVCFALAVFGLIFALATL